MLFKPLLTVYLQLPMVYESQLKGINKKEYGHGTLVHLYNMDIEIRMYFLYFSSSFFKFLDKGKKGLTSSEDVEDVGDDNPGQCDEVPQA